MIKTRTNIKIIPDSDTVRNLVALLESSEIEFDDFIKDPHCTIIYSRSIIDVNAIKLPEIMLPIFGRSPELEVFDTMDDGFCLVAAFRCRAAEQLSFKIRREYDLQTTYGDYRPHITIKKNIADKPANFPKIPFNLVFDRIKMDNGRQFP